MTGGIIGGAVAVLVAMFLLGATLFWRRTVHAKLHTKNVDMQEAVDAQVETSPNASPSKNAGGTDSFTKRLYQEATRRARIDFRRSASPRTQRAAAEAASMASATFWPDEDVVRPNNSPVQPRTNSPQQPRSNSRSNSRTNSRGTSPWSIRPPSSDGDAVSSTSFLSEFVSAANSVLASATPTVEVEGSGNTVAAEVILPEVRVLVPGTPRPDETTEFV